MTTMVVTGQAIPRADVVTARTYRPGPVPTALSVALAVVATVTCALTLFVPDVLVGPAVMDGSARGTALVALVVAVPLLVAALWFAHDGSLRAVPLWLGATAFLLYNSVLFVFATPFDDLFLLDVAMLSLALWSLVAALHDLDVPTFASRFAPTTPVRAVATYVGVVVVLNALAWLGPVLRAVVASGPPAFLVGTGMTTNPIYVQDLAFWLPAMGVGALWLVRRRDWGYVVVGAGLVLWVVESVSIAVDQWLGHAADPASSVASSAVSLPFGLLALVGMAPAYAMLHGLPARSSSQGRALSAPSGWTWGLVGVQLFVGAMAAWGAVRMMVDGFGMPTSWLAGTGFDSWALPGVALLVGVAAPQLVAAALVVTGSRWAVPVSWLTSVVLVLWIVVQMAVLQRYFFLQPVVVVLGLVEVGLLLAWQRRR